MTQPVAGPRRPLELLFDLAFVVAFGQAADQLTHAIVSGHAALGVGGFIYAITGIASVWVSFIWFGSAFGVDDWAYRLATMIQMIGVMILALGLPDFFRTLESGDSIDPRVIIAGYLVMRAATLLQWTRLARQDRGQRRSALQHTLLVGTSMTGWLGIAITRPTLPLFVLAAIILFLLEITGTRLVEQRSGEVGWNAHHIAERFGLLAIIALGEGVFGTIASVNALVGIAGWSFDAVTVVTAGVGLTFGLWWMYFVTPLWLGPLAFPP
ncbi:low temperature requirement protein A [Arthrobacter sp. MMS24-T111]